MKFFKYIFLAVTLFTFFHASAQNIFSNTELDYNQAFAPFELNWTVALPNQGSIILREDGDGTFTLIRYDEYFFDKWSSKIDYGKTGNHPQLYRHGDQVFLLRFWIDKNEAFIDIKYFDIETGKITKSESRKLLAFPKNTLIPKLTLSPDRSKILVYNFLSGDELNDMFEVYELESMDLLKRFSIEKEISGGKTKSVHLSDNGDVFFVLGNTETYTLEAYFQSIESNELSSSASSFTFDRPATSFKDIAINKQSNTSYFVTCPGYIDDELIGVNVSGFNVVLNNVLFTRTYNFDKAFSDALYQNAVYTTKDQRNKYLEQPENFDHFYLQKCMVNSRADVVCFIEYQDEPSVFHDTFNNNETPLKWRNDHDRYYDAEDLIVLSFSAKGDLQWKKLVQKFQESDGNRLNLSIIPQMDEDTLKFITQESSKGPSFYYFEINSVTGELISEKPFFDKNYYYNKNYCGWLDSKTFLLCAFKEGGRNKNLYLVEF